ncbi:MAG: citrate transporter [Lachnospiraceae bacterium]|jgi:di/tricarboxylate transporter|nr:citrate transporter [Lachnospiraceae bacterium]
MNSKLDIRSLTGAMMRFWKHNMMLTISMLAAVVTCFFVPPDQEYIRYFDGKTLVCLFCVLLIVRAFGATGLFGSLAGKLLSLCKTLRGAVLLLILITLIGSLLITNDMALLAFLPLGYFMLKHANAEKYLAYVFIVQTMAANLGGMLSPFGNPQNLYLYSYYSIGTGEFFNIMLLPFCVSVALTVVCCLFVPPLLIEPIAHTEQLPKRKIALYAALFVVVIFAIFRIVPYPIALIVPFVIAFVDRKILKEADYPLIFTFCAFFVFSGNLSRIPAVSDFLGNLVKEYPLLTAMGVSQIISNVPAAVLLSKFTDHFPSLLLGVNLGGVGTPVASLASLITIRYYLRYQPSGKKEFSQLFALLNVAFLVLFLLIFAS